MGAPLTGPEREQMIISLEDEERPILWILWTALILFWVLVLASLIARWYLGSWQLLPVCLAALAPIPGCVSVGAEMIREHQVETRGHLVDGLPWSAGEER